MTRNITKNGASSDLVESIKLNFQESFHVLTNPVEKDCFQCENLPNF